MKDARVRVTAAAGVVLLLAAGMASGGYDWNVASGNWVDAGSWTPAGGPPTASDDATIDNGGTATIGSSDAAVASTLVVALNRLAGNRGKIILNGGSLTVSGSRQVTGPSPGTKLTGSEFIGWGQLGEFEQTGGVHTVESNLYMGIEQHNGYGINGSGLYTLTGGGQLSVGGSLTVGYANEATFSMDSGTVTADALVVGETGGANGVADLRTFIQTGGTVRVNSVTLGKSYPGATQHNRYEISGEAVLETSALTVGNQRGASNTFEMTGGTVTVSGIAYVGNYGHNSVVNQSAGTMTITGELRMGYDRHHTYGRDASGTYNLSGSGVLSVGGKCWVGRYRFGNLNVSGGSATIAGSIEMGYDWSVGDGGGLSWEPAVGTARLTGGTLNLSAGNYVRVGYMGEGELYLGDESGTTTINVTGVGAGIDMQVRDSEGTRGPSKGLVQGWGVLPFTGTLKSNGRIVAQGYGTDRDLDLSAFTSFQNTLDNPVGGTNGWYATDHGRLLLPTLALPASGTTYWGEQGDLDLVNAVRIVTSGTAGGNLNVMLLASDRAELEYTTGSLVSVYDFQPAGFGFGDGTATLTFRYDDAGAAALGLAEADLRLYHFTGSQWLDVTASVDTVAKTITSLAMDSFSMFAAGAQVRYEPPAPAVEIPEPASGLALLAGLALVLRRRRRA